MNDTFIFANSEWKNVNFTGGVTGKSKKYIQWTAIFFPQVEWK